MLEMSLLDILDIMSRAASSTFTDELKGSIAYFELSSINIQS